MLSNSVIALIRTTVPLVAGWLIAQLALVGVLLPEGFETELTAGLTAVASAGYWALVTLGARRWPALGWLLGHPASPTYGDSTPAPSLEPLPGESREGYRARATNSGI